MWKRSSETENHTGQAKTKHINTKNKLHCKKLHALHRLGLCHNALTPARTPRLGLCHNALTPARTPWLGLCHNTLTSARTPRLGLCHNLTHWHQQEHQDLGCHNTDTSKNTNAWAVSQHTDTSKNTQAWTVSQHWHQQKHPGLGCGNGELWDYSDVLVPVRHHLRVWQCYLKNRSCMYNLH